MFPFTFKFTPSYIKSLDPTKFPLPSLYITLVFEADIDALVPEVPALPLVPSLPDVPLPDVPEDPEVPIDPDEPDVP